MSEAEEGTGPLKSALADRLTTDQDRYPFERESQILWSADTERAHVETTEPGLAKRFLHHPEFQLKYWVTRHPELDHGEKQYPVKTGCGTGLRDWEADGSPQVLLVVGTIPIHCVVVKEHPRTHGSRADVVTRGVLEGESADD